MTTAVEPSVNTDQYVGKDVILHYTDPNVEETQEVEGKVEFAGPAGLMIKIRGTSKTVIVTHENVVDIEPGAPREKAFKVKYIPEVTEQDVRYHLATMHAIPVSQLKSLTAAAALDWHATFNHDEMDVAHRHGEKPKRVPKSVSSKPVSTTAPRDNVAAEPVSTETSEKIDY